jgi:hypothetical protein
MPFRLLLRLWRWSGLAGASSEHEQTNAAENQQAPAGAAQTSGG